MEQIKIELALAKTTLIPEKQQTAYLMIKLTAPEQVIESRPAQNLSLCN